MENKCRLNIENNEICFICHGKEDEKRWGCIYCGDLVPSEDGGAKCIDEDYECLNENARNWAFETWVMERRKEEVWKVS